MGSDLRQLDAGLPDVPKVWVVRHYHPACNDWTANVFDSEKELSRHQAYLMQQNYPFVVDEVAAVKGGSNGK